MALSPLHELHTRRRTRNVGVGLLLAALIAVVFWLTVVKVTRGDFETPSTQRAAPASEETQQ